MEVLQKIITFFSSIYGFYADSQVIYAQIQTAYQSLTKVMDCDIYHPSSDDILKRVKENNPALYKQLVGEDKANFIVNNNIKSDILRNQIENSAEAGGFNITDVIDLSEFLPDEAEANRERTPLTPNDLNEALKRLARDKQSGDPCIEIKRDEEDREAKIKEIQEKIADHGQKEIEKELQEFLDSCNKKDIIDPEGKLGFEKFTKEEIEKAKENCFDENTPIPNDVRNMTDDEFNELKDPKESLSDEEDSEDDDETVPPSVEFSEESYEVLMDLMGEKSDCFSEMKKRADEMQEISKQYSDHVSTKIDVEKNYAYNRVFFAMYDEFDKLFGTPAVSLTPSLSDELVDPNVKEYSKEISWEPTELASSGGITFVELKINTIDNPKEEDGLYFETYAEVQEIMEQERFKKGEASQEEYEEVDRISKQKFEAALNQFESEIRSSAQEQYASLFLTIGLNAMLSGKSAFKRVYNKVKDDYLQAKDEYEKFDETSNNYIQEMKDKGAEMAQVAEELGCSDASARKASVEEEEFDLDAEGDFRGIPDKDKPTVFDDDYWKKFAQMATVVGLFPIPQFFGSNEFRMNLRDYTNPKIKLPKGSPAIDEDGIPRFLFYPIGFVIPTPFSPDFIYRIPLPMIWQHLFTTTISSPLGELTKKLTEFNSKIGGIDTIRKTLTDVHPNILWRKLPSGTIESIMITLGVNDDTIVNEVRKESGAVTTSFKNGLDAKLKDIGRDVIAQANGDINSKDEFIDRYIEEAQDQVDDIRKEAQKWLDANLKQLEVNINGYMKELDVSSWGNKFAEFSSQLDLYLNTAGDIMSTVDSCFGTDYGGSFSIATDNYLRNLKATAGGFLDGIEGLAVPKLTIPRLDLNEYLQLDLNVKNTIDFGFDFVTGEIGDLFDSEFFNSLNFFPKLKQLINIINDFIVGYYNDFLKYKLWETDFPLEDYLNLKIPDGIIDSLSLIQIDFPDMILVGFIGISGIIPYPFLLLINSSNKSVTGIIDERTIEFVLTLDFTDPIKVIKKNFGSYSLPIKTHIEDFINKSLGLTYSPSLGRFIDLCGILNGIGLNIEDIIGNFDTRIDFDFKPLDLFNLFELPNPNLLCKKGAAKSFKDGVDTALSEVKLDNATIPPTFSKFSELNKYGFPDLDGELMMDEFKDTFNVSSFPDVNDIVPIADNQKSLMLLKELGVSKKMIFDLIPKLSRQTPFLQDDLPPWERLKWWNIPFIAFLIEFNIAAKRGAKFPVPEVIPALDMS